MTDSRQAPRAPIATTIRLKSASTTDFLEHRAHDVSEGGMFVEAAEPMKVGTLLRMEMTFPSETEPVSAVARVVWTREAASATADLPAGMGVKFVKVDSAAKGAIQSIVEENKDAIAASNRGPGARGSLAGDAPAPAAARIEPAPVAKPEPKPTPAPAPQVEDEDEEDEDDEGEDQGEDDEGEEQGEDDDETEPEPVAPRPARAEPAPVKAAPAPEPKKAAPEAAKKDEPAKPKGKKSKKERRAEGRKKAQERKRAERDAAARVDRTRTSREPRGAPEMPLATEPGRGDAATRPLLIILIVLAIVAGIYFFTRTTDRPAPDQDSPAHQEHAEGEGETDTAE